MSKITDIMILVIGIIAILCVNAIAFVFDGEWINVVVGIDSMFIGALITTFVTRNK